jgi:hypothetical protein
VLLCLRFRLPSLICLRGSAELRGDDTRYANACNREHLLITSPKYRRVSCRSSVLVGRHASQVTTAVSPVTRRVGWRVRGRGSVSVVVRGDYRANVRGLPGRPCGPDTGAADSASASVCLTRLGDPSIADRPPGRFGIGRAISAWAGRTTLPIPP